MKLKKAKLAAVIVSALMAVGAMSSLVYADEDTAAAASTSTSDTGAYTVVEDSIQFAYTVENFAVTNPSMNVSYDVEYVADGEVTYDVRYATAEVFKTTDATCTENGITILSVTIQGKVYYSDEYQTAKVLGHSYSELKRTTITSPTHLTTGLAHVWYECSRCGATYDTDLVLDAQEHTYSTVTYEAISNILVDSYGKCVLGSDGLPQLDDPTKDGYYYSVYYCTENDGGEKDRTEVEILATKEAYAQITYQYGIADNLVDGTVYTSPSTQLPLDNDSIELTNCTKDGYYIITYYNSDGKAISEEKITVTAHHMVTAPTVEFKTTEDKAMCTVTYKADGTYTIVNNSCYLAVEYYEVYHCSAAGCPLADCTTDDSLVAINPYVGHDSLGLVSSTAKTAEPAGDHVIKTSTKSTIATMVAAGCTYEELQAVAKVSSNYVQVSNDTSTCTTDGTCTVEYLCMVCGTVVETETVKVVAKGHIDGTPTRENYVAPTCTSTGSYDSVVYCERCGEALRETRNITIPRIKHTNELSVTTAGVGTDDVYDTLNASIIELQESNTIVVDPGDGEYLTAVLGVTNINNTTKGYGAHIGNEDYPTQLGVYVYAVSKCDVCGYEVVIYRDVKAIITGIEKESSTGEAGSITVEFVYTDPAGVQSKETKEFDYYSTVAAYEARTEVTYTGLKLDSDGIYRYYVDSQLTSHTGIVSYQGENFFVANGELCSTANGLNLYNGTWYFLAEGRVVTEKTGLALYDGEWFYINKGVLDTSINGLVDYDGGTFLFAAGRLVDEYSGLYQDYDGTWYFLSLGQVQAVTTLVEYDGAWFYIVDGILAVDYTGEVEYDGATFSVVAGQVY